MQINKQDCRSLDCHNGKYCNMKNSKYIPNFKECNMCCLLCAKCSIIRDSIKDIEPLKFFMFKRKYSK